VVNKLNIPVLYLLPVSDHPLENAEYGSLHTAAAGMGCYMHKLLLTYSLPVIYGCGAEFVVGSGDVVEGGGEGSTVGGGKLQVGAVGELAAKRQNTCNGICQVLEQHFGSVCWIPLEIGIHGIPAIEPPFI
jgi:hypothetical protein